MELIKIDRRNIGDALIIQKTLFPGYDATANYVEAVDGISGYEYWILSVNGVRVGISGIYSLREEPQSAWLGWFGILSQYRKSGLGSEALSLFENEARERGFRFARLYTGRQNNVVAKSFYISNGYTEEYYDCREDSGALPGTVSIFSKKLYPEDELPPWNNKNMHLDLQRLKERNSQKF